MKYLDDVTLIALTSKDYDGHRTALNKSMEGIRWGGVKLIWDPRIKNIDDWNKAVIYDLTNYITTAYALLIHADGYVIRPDLWRDEFLDYDFVGAPWPLPMDNYSYRDQQGNLVRVGNSVSIRSKRLLDAPRRLNFEWRSFFGNTNEDGFLCCHHRQDLEAEGIKFAPLEVAKHFSKEHEIEENKGLETFAFHSL